MVGGQEGVGEPDIQYIVAGSVKNFFGYVMSPTRYNPLRSPGANTAIAFRPKPTSHQRQWHLHRLRATIYGTSASAFAYHLILPQSAQFQTDQPQAVAGVVVVMVGRIVALVLHRQTAAQPGRPTAGDRTILLPQPGRL